MLSTAARARLTVVLVGARNPSNIGAAARAMQDFGFSDLRIVNDFAAPFEAAQLEAEQLSAAALETKSAVAAQHVMQNDHRHRSPPAKTPHPPPPTSRPPDPRRPQHHHHNGCPTSRF